MMSLTNIMITKYNDDVSYTWNIRQIQHYTYLYSYRNVGMLTDEEKVLVG